MNWISTKERFPEKDGLYLAYVRCADGDITTILYFSKDKDFMNIPAVTHWMALPEPPK